ncbi:MAG: HAD family hydrolase [Deltaproteobacteria bacterium]|nr:HAD family hydrolase [Deltaproteobacteria bacterium]
MTIRPNPQAKLWLFDFDNTLAALEREVDWPGSRRELEAYLRAEGVDHKIFVEIPKGNLPLYSALHSRWLRTSASIASEAVPFRDAAQALLTHASEIIERNELIGVERAQPTPGAIDLLKALIAKGATVIIVTSNSSRTVARWLEIHHVSDLVDAIVGRDSLLALKPSPEMVTRALEVAATFVPGDPLVLPAKQMNRAIYTSAHSAPLSKAQVPIGSTDAVFVGDSEADHGAARASGVGFYGIAATDAARDRLLALGATNIFPSPAALLNYLNLA